MNSITAEFLNIKDSTTHLHTDERLGAILYKYTQLPIKLYMPAIAQLTKLPTHTVNHHITAHTNRLKLLTLPLTTQQQTEVKNLSFKNLARQPKHLSNSELYKVALHKDAPIHLQTAEERVSEIEASKDHITTLQAIKERYENKLTIITQLIEAHTI